MRSRESYEKASVEVGEARVSDVRDIWHVLHSVIHGSDDAEGGGISALSGTKGYFERRDMGKWITSIQDGIEVPSPQAKILVARDKGRIVGCAFVSQGEVYNSVDALYVLPEYLDDEVGRKLLGEADDFFGAEKEVHIGAADGNKRVISLLHAYGFEDTGKAYLHAPEEPDSAFYKADGRPSEIMLVRRKKASAETSV